MVFMNPCSWGHKIHCNEFLEFFGIWCVFFLESAMQHWFWQPNHWRDDSRNAGLKAVPPFKFGSIGLCISIPPSCCLLKIIPFCHRICMVSCEKRNDFVESSSCCWSLSFDDLDGLASPNINTCRLCLHMHVYTTEPYSICKPFLLYMRDECTTNYPVQRRLSQ